MRHEWPLVLFTALAVAGGGTLASQPLLLALGATDPAGAQSQAPWATALITVGLAVSMNHLGHSRRFLLASRRVGSSPLSTEVVLAAAVIACGALLAWLPTGRDRTVVLTWLTGAVAVAFLLSLGFVYRLRGQATWPGVAAISPLLSGLAFGFIARTSIAPAALAAVLYPTLILLAADGLAFGARWLAIARVEAWLIPSHPAVFRHRHLLAVDRLILVGLAPSFLLAIGAATLADLSIGLGLLVDRVAFYGLAVQHTTEAEIARAEAAIARIGRA